MCGIIGYIGKKSAVNVLITGLKRMEYRGYDSAGIAVKEKSGTEVIKKSGLVSNLDPLVEKAKLVGTIGIGHTRWATHGGPTDENAHPHRVGLVTLVHNGIIENYQSLKNQLLSKYKFKTQTDTEVLAALIDSCYQISHDPALAVSEALNQIRGTYGLVVMFDDLPDTIVAARRSSPVLLAQDGDSIFIASDPYALAGRAAKAILMNDQEIAICTPGKIDISSPTEPTKSQETLKLDASHQDVSLGDFKHFMIKEIHEQPDSLRRVLSGRLYFDRGTSQLGGLNLTPKQLRGVQSLLLIGCGSAYHAGLTAKYMLEPLLKIPINIEVSSELRYRNIALNGHELAIAISQSGETADTIACVEELKLKGIPVLGIINVVGSTIARMVDGGTYTHAGPEISVASTKAFTSQVTALLLLGIYMARQRSLTHTDGKQLINYLKDLPELVEQTLKLDDKAKLIANKLSTLSHLMVLGRDVLYPVSLETALKIKEVSYVPASGYPAGEMKHGPNALLGPEMGVIYMLPDDQLYEKALSNLNEVKARDAKLVVITDNQNYKDNNVLVLPPSNLIARPFLFAIAGQLLAYHIGHALGRDIDKPRNLAKSVTVE